MVKRRPNLLLCATLAGMALGLEGGRPPRLPGASASPGALALPTASSDRADAAGQQGPGESLLVELTAPSLSELLAAGGSEPGALHELGFPNLLERPNLARSSARWQAERRIALAKEQAPLAQAIAVLGGRVVAQYQVALNALLVHAPSGTADRLAHLPGVARVWRMPLLQMLLAESVPHVGAERVRRELGLEGRDVLVAIADAGIDYHHAALGGSGRLSDYDLDDENRIEPGTFPTARVVGGYDFAGQRYSPNCASLPFRLPDCHTEPSPDPDPLEPRELNHGTPAASILAGEQTRHVPAGVAPGAKLVALKIMGNPIGAPPASDLLPSALEWAVAHNLGLDVPGTAPPKPIDVLCLSVGYPWAAGLPPIDRAIDAAVAAGMTVVAAAGDGGNVPFIVAQPSAARRALSVGATTPPGRAEQVFGIRAQWRSGEKERFLTAPAIEADFTPSLRATGPITTLMAFYGQACSDDQGNPEPPEQDVRARVALIERGNCVFYDKLWNAARAGSVAAIVFSDLRDPIVMSCQPPSDCDRPPPIPAVMIERRPGLVLRDLLLSGTVVTAALAADLRVDKENLTDVAASVTSRGPARGGQLKPEVTAPGVAIYAASAGGGTFGDRRSGTSMAAPFVAGAAALLVERSRRAGLALEPLDVAAMLMNYADPVVRTENADTGPAAPVALQGAGRLNAWRSARGELVVRAAAEDGIGGIGLGLVHVLDQPITITRTLTVRNLSRHRREYRVQPEFLFPREDAERGVEISAPGTLTLEPGQTTTLPIRLRLDPARLRAWPLRGFGAAVNPAIVQRQEVDGHIVFWPSDANSGEGVVRAPFHALPRPHACISGEPSGPLLFTALDQTRAQFWQNPCRAPGSIEVFRLLGVDPVGDGPGTSGRADIDAVAVRYAPHPDRPGDHLLEFAIRTREPRRLPIEGEFLVYIDRERDGQFDRVLFNRLGRRIVALPEAANRWVVAHAPVLPGSLIPDYDQLSLDFFAQRFDLDETVSVLQASASSLGLDLQRADASFDVGVIASDASGDLPLASGEAQSDLAPDGLAADERYTFDARHLACLRLEGDLAPQAEAPVASLTLAAGEAAALQVRLACQPRQPERPLGFLVSYPDNWPPERQSELRLWRPLGAGNPLYLPLAARSASILLGR